MSFSMDDLFVPRHERPRCINAENRHGRKGEGAQASSPLGPGRKGSPCIDRIEAGGTAVLADVEGPGIVRHIWMTVTDRTSATGPNVLRDLVLEMYWDGESEPSVRSPLGDFFCCGHAQACDVISEPIMVCPNRGFNCFFPMPFEHMRIEVRNEHNEDVEGFFYQIDYAQVDALPREAMRFHAQWRRSLMTETARDYVILDAVRGRGVYVGTYLAHVALESRWWGEGEVKIFLDGDDKYPTWVSTGTEDYFGGAWSFAGFDQAGKMHERTYCGPYMGYPFHSRHIDGGGSRYWDDDAPVMRGLYRWHIPDPIAFDHDIRVTIQQIGADEHGLFERRDDVSSVAYWYQDEPHVPFPEGPERAMLRPR